ncbi:hypothetical protein QCA50_014149 [Cerrena zonata]|uniref:DUF6534 domain-containing protein n=1 Tax=Cerrena zonata TaxID=2478898 RepID=A0AAW0FPJ0_9APHY
MDALPSFISISSLVGGLVEVISISNITLGITIAQCYVYMQNWERDPKWVKVLAITIVLLEIGYTAFAQRVQYFYSVLAIENPFLVIKIDWSVPAALILGVFAELAVQGFYIHRIWSFSKNLLLIIGTCLLLISRHGLFINCIVDTLRFDTWPALQTGRGFKPSIISSMVVIMCTDAVIATTMVYHLHRKHSQFKRTQTIISRLVLYFVGSGALLVAASAAMLICSLVAPNNLLWGGFVVLYARVLSNSFFGALNARQLLRNKGGETITFGTVSFHDESVVASVELHKMQVQVDKDTFVATDSTCGK